MHSHPMVVADAQGLALLRPFVRLGEGEEPGERAAQREALEDWGKRR